MSSITAALPTGVIIVTRHNKDCKQKKDSKKCSCLRSLRYNHNGKTNWQATKERTHAGAERFLSQFIADFSKEQKTSTVTVRDAVESFLAQKRGQGVGTDVQKKFTRELARLVEFAERRDRKLISQITLPDLTVFRLGWEELYPSSVTRGAVQGRLRSFLEYCLYADMVTKNVAKGLSSIKADRVPTMPLSQEQYTKLLATIPIVHPESSRTRARVHGLLQCMRHSGLAIQDAVGLERSQLLKSKAPDGKAVWVIVTVRGKVDTADVFVPIPDEVAVEMQAAPNKNPRYFFWNTGNGQLRSAVVHWQTDLRNLFRTSGMPTGHPHQLRDTFACEMLGKGVPLELVSKMLGHSSVKVTEKHYAPWVKVRQDLLTSVVMSTWKPEENS